MSSDLMNAVAELVAGLLQAPDPLHRLRRVGVAQPVNGAGGDELDRARPGLALLGARAEEGTSADHVEDLVGVGMAVGFVRGAGREQGPEQADRAGASPVPRD